MKLYRFPLLSVVFAWLSAPLPLSPTSHAQELAPDFGVTATFSIVAVDPVTGECGAAVASKYPAVGKVVPYVRAGVGAFCTQHWHNPEWGERALDLLESGNSSEQVLGMLLADDRRRDMRQLAIIDMQGRAANRNPSAAPETSSYWGAMSGRFYACQGNTLTGRNVITAMAESYEETSGSLSDRLIAALVAADCAGGDHRGRLAAGIRVAKVDHPGNWLELDVDKSEDAVMELFRKYVDLQHEAKGDWTTPGMQPPCRNDRLAGDVECRGQDVPKLDVESKLERSNQSRVPGIEETPDAMLLPAVGDDLYISRPCLPLRTRWTRCFRWRLTW